MISRTPKLNCQQEREVRPRNATKDELKIIKRLSGKRTQRELAGFLGRSRWFVQHWQRRLEVRRWRKLDARAEREIVELYRSGKGQVKTGKLLGIQQKAVHSVVAKRGLLRKTGGVRFEMPPKQFRQFRKDVLSKKFYCAELARKYSLSRHNSLKLAKQILGVATFLRGKTHPPLSSVFPERHAHDQRCTVADCMTILSRLFPGGLPPAADCVVASAVVDLLLELPFWRKASAPVLENLEAYLLAAAATMRGAETTTMVN